MTAHFMVLLTDEGAAARGEVKFFNGADDVAQYIEVLLDGGFAKENILVFHGKEVELEISYRPVVSLSAAGEGSSDADADEPSRIGRNGAPSADKTPEGEDGVGVMKGARLAELFRPS